MIPRTHHSILPRRRRLCDGFTNSFLRNCNKCFVYKYCPTPVHIPYLIVLYFGSYTIPNCTVTYSPVNIFPHEYWVKTQRLHFMYDKYTRTFSIFISLSSLSSHYITGLIFMFISLSLVICAIFVQYSPLEPGRWWISMAFPPSASLKSIIIVNCLMNYCNEFM